MLYHSTKAMCTTVKSSNLQDVEGVERRLDGRCIAHAVAHKVLWAAGAGCYLCCHRWRCRARQVLEDDHFCATIQIVSLTTSHVMPVSLVLAWSTCQLVTSRW